MKKAFAIKSTLLVVGAYSIAIAACSAEGQTVQGGSGNRPGSGGTPGAGGTDATGGTPGVGGVVNNPGTGGTPPTTGGSFGTGGTPPATGGSFGAGGTPPAAGGSFGAGGTGASQTCTSTATAMTDTGGFLTSGDWKGYAFTSGSGTGTTISPPNFMNLMAGQAPCACGSVAGLADYSGTAMIGVNLNQESGSSTLGTITPGGTGLAYQLAGTPPAGLRIQIQGPNGGTDATQRWCANATGTSGQIPWTDFQFECWEGGTQTPFSGTEPIAAVLALVPGTNSAPVPFDFCVVSFSQY